MLVLPDDRCRFRRMATPTSPGSVRPRPFWGASAKLRHVRDHRRFGYLRFHQLGTPPAREPLGEAGTASPERSPEERFANAPFPLYGLPPDWKGLRFLGDIGWGWEYPGLDETYALTLAHGTVVAGQAVMPIVRPELNVETAVLRDKWSQRRPSHPGGVRVDRRGGHDHRGMGHSPGERRGRASPIRRPAANSRPGHHPGGRTPLHLRPHLRASRLGGPGKGRSKQGDRGGPWVRQRRSPTRQVHDLRPYIEGSKRFPKLLEGWTS
jgi:hypothetical protein